MADLATTTQKLISLKPHELHYLDFLMRQGKEISKISDKDKKMDAALDAVIDARQYELPDELAPNKDGIKPSWREVYGNRFLQAKLYDKGLEVLSDPLMEKELEEAEKQTEAAKKVVEENNSKNVIWADYKEVLTEGAVLVNAHSTEEFIKQAEQHNGRTLEGHFVNVDFSRVEEYFKDKFLPMPEIGRARVEYCDFAYCEDIKFPYDKAYLSNTSKTYETEMIKKQMREMGAIADVSFSSPEGIINVNGKFDIDVRDSNGLPLASFSLSEMPKNDNYKKAFMEALQNRVVEDEKALLDFVPESNLEKNQQKAMENRCKFFYENVKTENKIMFQSKEDAVKFMKYMSKRAENYEKKNFRGLQAHWKHQAKEFALMAEVMKRSDCSLDRCIKMINHPDLQTQRFLKVQRDSWVAQNSENIAKSIDKAKFIEQEIIKEQKRLDKRFFGLGYYIERTLNKEQFEQRQKRITALRADYQGMEKSLKTYDAVSDFDKQIMRKFNENKKDITVTMANSVNQEIQRDQQTRTQKKTNER